MSSGKGRNFISLSACWTEALCPSASSLLSHPRKACLLGFSGVLEGAGLRVASSQVGAVGAAGVCKGGQSGREGAKGGDALERGPTPM